MLTAIYSLALDMDKIFEGKAEYFGCTVATASNPGFFFILEIVTFFCIFLFLEFFLMSLLFFSCLS